MLIKQMFDNLDRVIGLGVFINLDFSRCSANRGRWLVLDFQSFSAAKKTLETFDADTWFGINKYWLREGQVVCEATGQREDFETGPVVTDKEVEEVLLEWDIEEAHLKEWRLHYENKAALKVLNLGIQERLDKKAKDEEKAGRKQ